MGVWIERAGHEADDQLNHWYTSYKLYLAEQPPSYTGDIFDARVVLRAGTGPIWYAFYQYPEDPSVQLNCCSTLVPSIANGTPQASPGDLIQFEGRGPTYVITGIDNFKIQFRVDDLLQDRAVQRFFRSPPSAQERPSFQPGVRFEIFRRPVKTAGTPLEMPRNTGIDLSLSGYDAPFQSPYQTSYPNLIPNWSGYPTRFREISPEYDIVIMFSPTGGVDRVHYISHEIVNPAFWEKPQGTISLLLARDDQIGRDALNNLNVINDHITNVNGTLGERNLRDQDNLWLMISTQTGRVLTAPNGNAFANASTGAEVTSLPLTPGTDAREFVNNARRFSRTGQTLGGR